MFFQVLLRIQKAHFAHIIYIWSQFAPVCVKSQNILIKCGCAVEYVSYNSTALFQR